MKMRALGRGLAVLRGTAKLTTLQVAQKLGVSTATVSRTETADRVAKIHEVAALLAIYEASKADRARLMGLAADLNATNWIEVGARMPRLLPTICEFEAAATTIVQFSPLLVPGLLQTPAYSHALHASAGFTEEEVRIRTDARMDRQKILHKLVSPRYVVVLDEAVLRRPFGGSEAMVQQINLLIEMAKEANFAIHVIPFKFGAYGNPGYISLLNFRDEPPTLYFEHSCASGFLDEPADVDRLTTTAGKLIDTALDSADTVKFLKMMAREHERS